MELATTTLGGHAVENEIDEQARLLVHVRFAAAAVDECLHSLRHAVGRARAAGTPWARIGEVLGISEQAATEEFSGAESLERP